MLCLAFALFIVVSLATAQDRAAENVLRQSSSSPVPAVAPAKGAPAATEHLGNSAAALVISSGDDLEITVYGAPDLSSHTRVSNEGDISLPLIGAVRVAGFTSGQAERIVEGSLRQANLVKNPQVSVYVKEYASAGVSVVGQVSKPGVYPALGPHRLFDILQAAGGTTDKAADNVWVSHRAHPEEAVSLKLSKNPAETALSNIELQPGDTIVVPEAGIVYVLGEVNKPGGYVMNSSGGVTVLQLVAAAGGPTRMAAYGGVKMIRRTSAGLQELPVPLKPLLQAKVADVRLQPGDILFVPGSKAKAMLGTAGTLVNTAGSAAIYKIP